MAKYRSFEEKLIEDSARSERSRKRYEKTKIGIPELADELFGHIVEHYGIENFAQADITHTFSRVLDFRSVTGSNGSGPFLKYLVNEGKIIHHGRNLYSVATSDANTLARRIDRDNQFGSTDDYVDPEMDLVDLLHYE